MEVTRAQKVETVMVPQEKGGEDGFTVHLSDAEAQFLEALMYVTPADEVKGPTGETVSLYHMWAKLKGSMVAGGVVPQRLLVEGGGQFAISSIHAIQRMVRRV
jgi:hypothetical protein